MRLQLTLAVSTHTSPGKNTSPLAYRLRSGHGNSHFVLRLFLLAGKPVALLCPQLRQAKYNTAPCGGGALTCSESAVWLVGSPLLP